MAQSIPKTLIEVIDSIVRQATGRRPHEVETLRGDSEYWILSVRTAAHDAWIVKLASSTAVPSFEAAKAKHDLIRHAAEVPMAHVVAADDTATRVPFRYSIQTRLSGEEWFTRRDRLDVTERDRALANLGDVVARLHQAQLPAFGALPDARETECLPALLAHARSIIRDERLCAQFAELLEGNAHLWADAVLPAITHDDLHGFNVLFHPDRPTEVSGILDFDKAWSGPAESDLARMELWRGMCSPAFLTAYRERIEGLPGYGHRRPFYQLLWCLEFAQNTADHLKTTNALAARLGMPQFESFG